MQAVVEFFRVAQYARGAELNIAIRKQALGDGEESRKVILHQRQETARAALDQVIPDDFPVFEIFPASAEQTGEDLISAIVAHAGD